MACHRTLLSRGAALGVCLAVASAVVFAQPAGAPPSAAPAQPSASSARAAEKPYSFTLKPVVIDTASSSGAALGLDYELKGNFKFGRNGQTSVGSQTLTLADVEKTIVIGQLDLLA